MPTTPLGIPYFLTLTDPPDGGSQSESQARAVDTLITPAVKDTGWITTGVVGVTLAGAASGAGRSTISLQQCRRFGPFLIINIDWVVGTAITGSATGNIGNVAVALLPTALRPASTISGQGVGPRTSGGVANYAVANTGLVSLTALAPNVDLAVGQTMSVSGVIFAA